MNGIFVSGFEEMEEGVWEVVKTAEEEEEDDDDCGGGGGCDRIGERKVADVEYLVIIGQLLGYFWVLKEEKEKEKEREREREREGMMKALFKIQPSSSQYLLKQN